MIYSERRERGKERWEHTEIENTNRQKEERQKWDSSKKKVFRFVSVNGLRGQRKPENACFRDFAHIQRVASALDYETAIR